MSTALLSSTYFGPIQWYQKLHRYDRVMLEQCDSFIKQTYRNRCVIATTQGLQALTIPIDRSPIAESDVSGGATTRISNHGKWRTEHWNALCSAYGDSPFFDYYVDDLRPFFELHWEYLYDFNLAITLKMCELLDIRPHIETTSTFVPPSATSDSAEQHITQLTTPEGPADDFRDAIRPKHPLPDPSFEPRPYYQVYQQKHGFLPNLSILDLLFNMGNESIFYL
ncbi:MAG: WbqC family protein [Prevotella sp.]|nr:WbqC family protein [Prevotella sp.]